MNKTISRYPVCLHWHRAFVENPLIQRINYEALKLLVYYN